MINNKKLFYFNLSKNKIYQFIKKIKYLLIIFLISFFIYLITPKIFDYSKKVEFINNALNNSYSLKINDYSNISYRLFPTPRIVIKDTNLEFNDSSVLVQAEEIILKVKLSEMYNLKNLNLKKLIINKSEILLDVKNLSDISNYIKKIKEKFFFYESNIRVKKKDSNIISFEKINFNNRNFNKLTFKGIVFNQKIDINFYNSKNMQRLTASMPETGFNLEIYIPVLRDSKITSGRGNITILKNKAQFNFKKEDNLKIFNSFLITDIFNTTFLGDFDFNPNFNFNIIFNVKNINFKNLNKLLIKNINSFNIKMFNLNKKLNGQITILYDKKNFYSKFIKSASINIMFENGEISIKDTKIDSGSEFTTINGIFKNNEGYQKLDFHILSKIKDNDMLINKLQIRNNDKKQIKNLELTGSFNITSNKINLDNIIMDNQKKVSAKKLNFYEESFENIIFDNNFMNIFDFKRIKKFIEFIF